MIAGVLLIGVMISVGDSLDRYGRPPYSTTNFQIIDEPEAFRDDEWGEHGLDDVATLTFDGASGNAVVFKDPGKDNRYRYHFSPGAYVAMQEIEFYRGNSGEAVVDEGFFSSGVGDVNLDDQPRDEPPFAPGGVIPMEETEEDVDGSEKGIFVFEFSHEVDTPLTDID